MAMLTQPIDFGSAPDYGLRQMPTPIPMGGPKKKAGMFGSGANIGEMLLGALSGYLASKGNPMGAMGLHAINQRHQDDSDAQRAQQDRENQFQDFVRKESWKIANGGAPTNDTVADYNFRAQVLGEDAAKDWLRNPPQYMNLPGVGIVQVPRMGGGQMAAPTAPVGKLSPIDEGGPMPSASGGFPRPF